MSGPCIHCGRPKERWARTYKTLDEADDSHPLKAKFLDVLRQIREEGERRGGSFIWTRQLEVIEPLERMEGARQNATRTT